MDTDSLRAAFDKGFGILTESGTPEDFFDFIAEDALFIDEDMPLVLDKTQLRDHIGFHTNDIWERIYTTWRDLSVEVYGSTGAISANYQLRGKPRDAGYRQRDGMISLLCHYDDTAGRWTLLKCHMGPILSAIYHSSPG